jgi:uncharacterized repeat protein (TIGR04138 family)
MSDVPTIDGDVPCSGCGYNLRTLKADARCPECGREVTDSVTDARATHEAAADVYHYLRRRPFEALAASVGYPVDAVMFVRDALRWVEATGRPHPDGRLHATALDVCRGVRDYAARYFNDQAEALDLLAEWKLRSSEDVGRIIYGMVEAGLLKTSRQDSPCDFDSLFVLDDLFTRQL